MDAPTVAEGRSGHLHAWHRPQPADLEDPDPVYRQYTRVPRPWWGRVDISTEEKQDKQAPPAGEVPVNLEDIIRLLCHVSDQQKMRAAVKHSARGALVAGAGAFLGGLMGGPPGLAVGGAVGGLVGAWMTSRRFKPITQIIMELPPVQQKTLCDRVYAIVRNLIWKDVNELIEQVHVNHAKLKKVADVLISFVTQELQVEIQYDD